MFKKNQKLAGLWLAGEMVNHVGIYGSKAAEGLSAFQRRFCLNVLKAKLDALFKTVNIVAKTTS